MKLSIFLTLLAMINNASSDPRRIEIKDMQNNPGILPLKLGPARIQYTQHTFIHNYPFPPLRDQILKLKTVISQFDKAKVHTLDQELQLQYLSFETDHLIKNVLTIHPDFLKPQTKNKRGLVNVLGSIFKFISGNLDASDGERYDHAIAELSSNQQNIVKHFDQQLSINKQLVKNYEDTLRNISMNFQALDEIINELTEAEGVTNLFNTVKFVILDLKTLINEIQTALSFATIGILHMSIIDENQINNMKKELQKLQEEQSFYSNENVLFVRTISVDFYVTPDHIVFLLHVPLLDKITFNLYHLYSVPTPNNTVIIPPTSHVAISEDNIYYLKEKCKFLQEQYFCSISQIEKNYQQDTCIKNLLQVKHNPQCKNIPVNISEPLIETINDEKYLAILPRETLFHEKCDTEEVHKLKGVFLIRVPFSCKFVTKDFTYVNFREPTTEEPVYLPPLIANISNVKPIHLNLKSVNLDQLSKLTLQTNEPYMYTDNQIPWSRTNIMIYCIIAGIVLMLIFKLYKNRHPFIKLFSRESTKPDNDIKLEAFPTPARAV